ncbi:MAG TPA: 23S rRNA (guanosine(2251)-2'-O)-methyltransferase RlmB [Streptosporangiaceae bacterium]|jgi:23S rRNA (guanosine2251-2'-O)-methyltransferase
MSGRTSRQPRPGAAGRTKTGKPRPGTGGYGKRKLEGKGPTPPASMRPGHPAQRRAAAQARAAARPADRPDGRRPDDRRPDDWRSADWRPDDARPAEGRSGDRRGSDRPSGDRGADGRGSRGYPGGSGRPAGSASRGSGSTSRGAGSAAEIVAGRNAVLESLRARVPASALHVGPRLDADERIGEAVMLAADTGIPVVEAGRAELDRMTGGAIHQGLALKVAPYSYAAPGDLVEAARDAAAQPLIVALDGITDPRNLGAIARSVAAFGGHGILVPVRRSAGVSAGAWKASAGALARVPVAQASNLAQALAAYQQAGLFVVGLDSGGSEDIGQLQLADSPLVLVVGAEGRGLSRLIAERCDAIARIPITGAESLNASVAASIALYAVSQLRA